MAAKSQILRGYRDGPLALQVNRGQSWKDQRRGRDVLQKSLFILPWKAVKAKQHSALPVKLTWPGSGKMSPSQPRHRGAVAMASPGSRIITSLLVSLGQVQPSVQGPQQLLSSIYRV